MDKDEYRRMKSYFLSQARKYEKNGFSFAALELYRNFQPSKARRIYASIGKKAEKAGFLWIAVDAYQATRMIKKSRSLWRKWGLEMQKNNLPTLAAEAFEKLRPENPKYEKNAKLSGNAFRLRKEGKFREAKVAFAKAAKYREKTGDFAGAALFYFDAGDIRNAERARKKMDKK